MIAHPKIFHTAEATVQWGAEGQVSTSDRGLHGEVVVDPLRLVRGITREARHLHELERAGESEWTPWIAIAGLLVFLTTIFVVMAGLAGAADYIAR
jgi:hypothetical protein